MATPGRLWELMNEHMNTYLLKSLPLIDCLVLDEADRMIADGHFKEMRDILAHIYIQRVKIKNNKKSEQKRLAANPQNEVSSSDIEDSEENDDENDAEEGEDEMEDYGEEGEHDMSGESDDGG